MSPSVAIGTYRNYIVGSVWPIVTKFIDMVDLKKWTFL